MRLACKIALTLACVLMIGCGDDNDVVEDMFERLDSDNSDTLSEEEFSVGLQERDAFGFFDRDGDSVLDEDEFEKMVEDLESLDIDFEDYDINEDEIIEWSEFSSRTFVTFDSNDDGTINRQEFNFAFESGLL